jgi:hypothetical protein
MKVDKPLDIPVKEVERKARYLEVYFLDAKGKYICNVSSAVSKNYKAIAERMKLELNAGRIPTKSAAVALIPAAHMVYAY